MTLHFYIIEFVLVILVFLIGVMINTIYRIKKGPDLDKLGIRNIYQQADQHCITADSLMQANMPQQLQLALETVHYSIAKIEVLHTLFTIKQLEEITLFHRVEEFLQAMRDQELQIKAQLHKHMPGLYHDVPAVQKTQGAMKIIQDMMDDNDLRSNGEDRREIPFDMDD